MEEYMVIPQYSTRFLRWFLLSAILSVSCGSSDDHLIDAADRPNIVLIMADDLGKEWISAYGAEDIQTPHIDALASEGILFRNVYSMPQCTPSRVTLLTGQYPFRHGWVNHWDVPRWGGGAHFDETMNPSLAIEMKKAGYATCVAGKWQIDDFRVEPDALTNNGFDSYCMWTGYETGVSASANRYVDPYLYTQHGSMTHESAFGPDVFTEHIVQFIKENRNDPFFIYYPMVLPHGPFVNTPDDTSETRRERYIGMVRYLDKLSGQVIGALEESNVIENTVIIWTSDNGSPRSISGKMNGQIVQGGKGRTSESGTCVPFIVRWDSAPSKGSQSDALIDFSDLFPTILDLAGVRFRQETPGSNVFTHDGQSFKNVLLGIKEKSERNWILSMGGGNHASLTENGVENQYNFRDRVVRNERYKLYIDSERKAAMFVDLLDDPFETNNLLDSLHSEDRLSNFQSLFDVSKQFPEKDQDPIYKPNPGQPWDVDITATSEQWKK